VTAGSQEWQFWHFPNSELHGGVSNTWNLVTVLTYVALKLLHAVFGELDDKTINQIHGKTSLSQYFTVTMLKFE